MPNKGIKGDGKKPLRLMPGVVPENEERWNVREIGKSLQKGTA